ncbi:hypothetical protein SAMN05444360_12613 [Chryseobacterium carnipullorum]|nr:hypothetical protein SAMN05444360_12613 [Chryseobacterium carnipullorum]
MNNLDAIYNFILNELKKLIPDENFYFKPIEPKLSDLQIIALNISAEYLSIDSEYQLFRYLSNSKLNGMIERSDFMQSVLFQGFFKVLIFLQQAFTTFIFYKI